MISEKRVKKAKGETNIIALITDFGTADYYVGAMKGVILSINPNANIVDITHETPAQNILSANFTLRACCGNFPKKTIFVAIVDPGVGSSRKAIIVVTEDYFFIAPDNGLLSFIFNDSKDFKVFTLAEEKFFRPTVSRTFHGRDIFAPVAAHLSNGADPEEFGEEINDYVCHKEIKPRVIKNGEIEATIINIDRFGNIVTNLERDDISGKFTVKINENIIENLCEHYSEAVEAEVFMIWGSAGYLEISVYRDSAARLLKAETGQQIKLRKIIEKP